MIRTAVFSPGQLFDRVCRTTSRSHDGSPRIGRPGRGSGPAPFSRSHRPVAGALPAPRRGRSLDTVPGSRGSRRASALLTCVLCLFGALSTTFAEERGLKPIYDYVVEVSGVTDNNWKVYAPEQKNRLLLISPPGDLALLVVLAEKAVRPVDRTLMMTKSDGSIDLLAGAASTTRIIPLEVKGATAGFTVDGRPLALKPRPALLGLHTLQDLVSDRPSFGEGIRKYQPESGVVSFLKSYAKPTEIEVYFGSWCPVCEAWVPRFLKSIQQAGNSHLDVKLFGVPKDFSNDQEIAKKKGIRGLPTFIIRQEGIEVGRIVGAPEKGTLEAAVADVLRAKS